MLRSRRGWSLLLSGAAALSAAQPARSQEPAERLIFATFRPANWDVYHIPAPGAPPIRLTHHPGLDYDPVVSPDGRWVVFTSERRGSPDLFALDLREGGPPRLLVESAGMEDQAAFTPDGRTLVFVGTREGNADVFALPFRPERTQAIGDARNLTQHPGGEFRPAVSPDGRWLAFSSDRAHPGSNANPIARLRGGDLYLMPIEGGPARRLTETAGWSGSPAWSPDGSTVYFYRREGAGASPRFSLWGLRPHAPPGGDPWRVLEDDARAVLSPTIGPDGRIVFASGRPAGPRATAGAFALYSVRPDGSDRRLETDTIAGYMAPSFAPGGGLVAHGPGPVADGVALTEVPGLLGPGPLLAPDAPWTRALPDRELEVYPIRELFVAGHASGDSIVRTPPPGPRLVISALDGRGAREVTALRNPGFPAVAATASPDGRWIAHMRGAMFGNPDQDADLWRVRSDGTGAENLTPDSPGNDGFPSYAADGSWLAFRSGRTGNFDIFRMEPDGRDPRNLTRHPARDVFPAVSPAGDAIVFASDRDAPEPRLYDLYLLPLSRRGALGSVRRLTDNSVQEGHPHFSPDGRWIVFTSEMGGIADEEPLVQSFVFSPQMYGEIYALHLADGTLVRLTHDKWEDGFPTWVRGPAQ